LCSYILLSIGVFRSGGRRSGRLPVLAPLALEAVKKIDAIFDIEREINGLSAEERLSVRRSRIVPLVASLEDWMRAERAKLSRHAEAAKAMDYMLKRWASFKRFLQQCRRARVARHCARPQGVAVRRF
jgi:transposase